MATCKDCLHVEVCRVVDAYGDESAVDCSHFKERTQYIEQRHGRWLYDSRTGIAFCSECQRDAVEADTDYCPNCGAKMDLED